MTTEIKHISIQTLRHAKTGMLVAVSADMSGLCVHGRNDDELTERIPVAIRTLLEASGKNVVSRSEEHTSELQSPTTLFPYTTLFRSMTTN